MACFTPLKGGRYRWDFLDKEIAWFNEFVEQILQAKGQDPNVMDGRRFERNVEGYLAEYTACVHYGQAFLWSVHGGRGDTGVDFEVSGVSYGVKGVRDENRRLAVKKEETKGKEVPDVYILAVVNLEKRCVILKGQIDSSIVFDRMTSRFRDDGYENYIVESHELSAIVKPRNIGAINPDYLRRRISA